MSETQDPHAELESLRRRVAELEDRDLFYRSLLDLLPQSIYRLDRDGRCIFANKALLDSLGMTLEELRGKTSGDLYPPELAAKYQADDRRVLEDGEVLETIEPHVAPTKEETLYVKVIKAPIRGPDGSITGLQGLFWDVTASYNAKRLVEELKRKDAAMGELGTPLLPIADGIVVMPLIGDIDEARAEQVMETLLHGVTASRAAIAILDVTGVKMIDTKIADALMRAAQAVNLLGAQVVLTGINPHLAQTLVTLNVNLGGVETRSTLQSGVTHALQQTRRGR